MNGRHKSAGGTLEGYEQRKNLTKTLRVLVCVFLCILSLLPFIMLFVNSTRDSNSIKTGITLIPGKFLLTNIASLAKKSAGLGIDFWRAMLNSFKVAVPATALSVYFSALTAYGIYVYNFRLKKFAYAFILAVMIVPNTVAAIGFYRFMLKLGLADSYIPLIIPSMAAPAVVFFMRQYFQSTLSVEMVEAARIDGSGELHTFNTIVLPIAKPALATQAIFQFIASWNNLFTPTLIISSDYKKTLPMFVQILKSDQFRTDYGMVYLGLAATILPLFVVYFLLSKYIVAGVALGGVKE
ncbi:MAG: carbohydrate ABC transporter permease [Oscillospiraceae bacterium]|nr:carbohydrate ABC transporter permease [Oscillospiraceae bacterium]